MDKLIIQISSGRGPVECARVVAKVKEKIVAHAKAAHIALDTIEEVKGDLKGTFLSVTLLAFGHGVRDVFQEWEGTIQWIAESPYRKFHKRKNWFVGVSLFDPGAAQKWNPKDVVFETCRSGGPGGQNVNKVETAVRGIHQPSGISVTVTDTRSQLQNKQLCLQRLEEKFHAVQAARLAEQQQSQWQEHNELERGDAVKVLKGNLL
ncbi:peptide chain release factor [Chitinophaga skermanii]|uniref:Peptide chain release factor n=1 Tax=Chitinophaga skermanii TaxID=331697 RepID=A0A327QVF3_9BACT|nr:peptide chain release factor H [Chitinophaga skermanii]RAJ08589.1 peptide chain release factor [Chitinophaga skermanii]